MIDFERGLYAYITRWKGGSNLSMQLIKIAYHLHHEGIHRVGIQDIDAFKRRVIEADKNELPRIVTEIIIALPVADPEALVQCYKGYLQSAEMGFELMMLKQFGPQLYTALKLIHKPNITDLCNTYI